MDTTKTPETATPSGSTSAERESLQFVSLFVHDLEGPLVSMKTLVRLLEKDKFDIRKPAHRSLLNSGKIALDRAEGLVYDLLTAARAGQTSLEVNLTDCQLKQLVADSCIMAEPAAAENQVHLAMHLPSEEISVQADRVLLERVMDNLLFNAIRHTPPEGRVDVSIRPGREYAEILVSDTGPGFGGIDPEDLFSIFKQTKYRVLGLHRGVGIGLHLCRLAVEKMNGKITAENGPEGGAVFRFTIPCGRKNHED